MRGILRRSVWKVSLISVVFLLFAASERWPVLALSAELSFVLEVEPGGQRHACFSVNPGDVFQIEFLHSYDLFPVKEFYRIEGQDEIRLFKMIFRSLLGGQGFVHPGMRIRADGWGEIANIEMISKKVEFIMGAQDKANHRLTLRGVEYRLSDAIAQGTFVVLRVLAAPCS